MSSKPEINDVVLFDVFEEGFDRFRFPADICRTTAGNGGEALLIFGSEKTALYDCGMAYCGKYTVENIKKALEKHGRKTLDYVVLSHSHYDHIGALPHIRKAFPEAVVYGSEKCKRILSKPNAKQLIKDLGTAARDLYLPDSREDIPTDDLEVDVALRDGDQLSLGEETLTAIETKGHTDCSLSYALEPVKLLFTSESTGILEGDDYVHTPFLKDYNDSIASIEKCMDYGAEYLCLPHLGMLPKEFNDRYWELLKKACDDKMAFIKALYEQQLTEDEIFERYVEQYWDPNMKQIQPKDAFLINSRAIVRAFLKAVETYRCAH